MRFILWSMTQREYIPVAMNVETDENGVTTPLAIKWRGKSYGIKKVLDVRKGVELKRRERGTRYIVIVGTKQHTLYSVEEEDKYTREPRMRWYLEKIIEGDREYITPPYRHPHSPDYY